jgi:hypothetical protein
MNQCFGSYCNRMPGNGAVQIDVKYSHDDPRQRHTFRDDQDVSIRTGQKVIFL